MTGADPAGMTCTPRGMRRTVCGAPDAEPTDESGRAAEFATAADISEGDDVTLTAD